MLVLSRRRNESVMIGDNVEFKVVDIARNQVKIGIQAPTEIPVHRREVWERIQAEKAGGTSPAQEENDPVETRDEVLADDDAIGNRADASAEHHSA